jgi:hypothetical protein
MQRLKMSGAIPPLPHKPARRGGYLSVRDIFALTIKMTALRNDESSSKQLSTSYVN